MSSARDVSIGMTIIVLGSTIASARAITVNSTSLYSSRAFTSSQSSLYQPYVSISNATTFSSLLNLIFNLNFIDFKLEFVDDVYAPFEDRE